MNVETDVVALRRKHIQTWRDKPIWYWAVGLVEEVVEYLLSLVGLHSGPPEWELTQISAICMNLIEVHRDRKHEQRSDIPSH